MSGYEEQVYARAEMLDETGHLSDEVTAVYTGAAGAGVDPGAVARLADAIREVDPAASVPAYNAGGPHDRHAGSGYRSDGEFLEAVAHAEEEILIRRVDVQMLQEEIVAATDTAMDDLDAALEDLRQAQDALSAAYAMPTWRPCEGCHVAKRAAIAAAQAAIDQAEAAVTDTRRRIGLLSDAAEILDPLCARLTHAIEDLHQVPHDLGDVYELIYAFIQRGGKMPRYGRWIEGAQV